MHQPIVVVVGVLFIVALAVVNLTPLRDYLISFPAAETGSMLPDQALSPSQSNTQPGEVALLSMRGGDGGYGFHTIEGQVQNLTDSNLENVMAVVTWYTDDNQFITSDETLIEYNPILPGQTSPFEVMSRSNPAMSNYRVEFKTMFGGTLRQEDQR